MKSFTGEQKPAEMINDVEELKQEDIRKILTQNKIIKRQKGEESENNFIPESIECEKSVYLFAKRNCFRLRCY